MTERKPEGVGWGGSLRYPSQQAGSTSHQYHCRRPGITFNNQCNKQKALAPVVVFAKLELPKAWSRGLPACALCFEALAQGGNGFLGAAPFCSEVGLLWMNERRSSASQTQQQWVHRSRISVPRNGKSGNQRLSPCPLLVPNFPLHRKDKTRENIVKILSF